MNSIFVANTAEMREKQFRVLAICLWVAFFIGVSHAAIAQDPPPPSTCLPTDPDYDPRICVPIDGGLAFLLAAGVGYGVMKNRKDQKQKKQNSHCQ